MRRNEDDDDPFDGAGGIDRLLDAVAGGDEDQVDVFEYDDQITVVADVPGVDAEDVDLQCDGRFLAIRAGRGRKPFVARVNLPGYVDDRSASTSLNNGVLEVTLDRDTDPANIGFQ